MQGIPFDGDLKSLNPRPNPGTMNFYLGKPKHITEETKLTTVKLLKVSYPVA